MNLVIRDGYELFIEDFYLKNGKIDWINSINKTIRIMYDFKIYYIKIVDYQRNGNIVTVEFKGDRYKLYSSNIKKCAIGKLVKKVTKDFKIEIGTSFKDDKRDLVITDREYRRRKHSSSDSIINEKWYKYTCNKCGWTEGWIIEGGLDRGNGCSCCCNPPRNTILGINTIWDTDRWMCDLGVSEEDAKKYTKSSSNKVEVICPDCGCKKKVVIYNIYNKKSICCSCGDGFSYPEKFMNAVLTQLGIQFETEYSPDYLKIKEGERISKKRSDFYIPSLGIIIETDGGLGHKGGKTHSKSKLSIDRLIEIDKWKDERHLLHGIETIRINCFESDMEYIKNNILNSKLNSIFDLSKINWLKCEEFALGNLAKEVCDYWKQKNECETTGAIANKFNLNKGSIRNYLKKGTKLGWCKYDPKEEMSKSGKKASAINFKHVKH